MPRLLLSSLTATMLVAATATSAVAADDTEIYVVHGLPGTVVDLELDGEQVGDDVEVTDVTGPFTVDADGAELTVLDAESGEELMEYAVEPDAETVTDVVLHLPADPEGDPVATTFDLDLAAQPADKGSLLVAHTAAVAPADIRVDGEVLFSNVANGESLSVVVPAQSYEVDIVPTGEQQPVVFGPVDLPVAGGTFHAVYAVGDPSAESMTVALHTIEVDESGSTAPERVESGRTGLAAAWSSLQAVLSGLRQLY